MPGSKCDVLLIKHDMFQDSFDVISMYPVIAIQRHVGDGGGALSHLQMAHIQPFALQGVHHPLPVLIAAGSADDGGLHPQFLQVDPGVHHVARGILAIMEHVSLSVHVFRVVVDTVVTNHCCSHRFVTSRILDFRIDESHFVANHFSKN